MLASCAPIYDLRFTNYQLPLPIDNCPTLRSNVPMPDAIHRMADSQLPQVLHLLASAGATPRTVDSWNQDHMGALLLGDKDSPTAAMPFAKRTIKVAPDRTVNVGWLSSNMFPTRMGFRRHGRNTANLWAQLLPDVDALLVVRRDQPSLTARWYTQVGFHQILAIRCLYLEMESPPASPAGRYRMAVVGPDELAPWQDEMLSVHRDVFGNYGGPVVRHADFWRGTLAHHYYKQHYQFQVIGLWSEKTLMGYAVVGWSGWHSKRPRMDILELATRQWDAGVALELIQTASQLAWSKGVPQVRAVISVHDPYRSALARIGFEDKWGYVMLAKWLHPQRYLDGLVRSSANLSATLEVRGEVPLSMRSPDAGPNTPAIRVQADAATLTKLLLQRIETSAALHDGSLLALQPPHGDLPQLSMVLPWTPWVFHMLDYI
jgi:hypothetical protein